MVVFAVGGLKKKRRKVYKMILSLSCLVTLSYSAKKKGGGGGGGGGGVGGGQNLQDG